MAEPRGHRCPECGAPRAADNTPSCACGERAAEALRDARTAAQAAAEDFDPLRIRPYVALDAALTEPHARTTPPPAEPTLPLPDPTPPAGVVTEPTDVTEPEAHPRTSRRRTALLAASGAVITVAAAAGFAGGLFSYEPPARDSAAPEPVREAVPEARTTQPSPTPTATSAPPTPHSPTPTPTATRTPSPTPTTPPASPTPSPTPTPSPPPTARATGSLTPSGRDEPAPVLRPGDTGPEVTELQLRLRQLYLYNDDPHGHYTPEVENAVRNYQWARGVQTDELGVYGAETRQKLESETSEP